jgi:GT2 family glycosyltransferase
MKVSVIIVNYNTVALTSNCIRSVIKYTTGVAYEIVLVDNASAECDAAVFLSEFPEIMLVKSPVNGGFATGNNLGIEKATGEFILLLNSDTVLTEDSITKAVARLEQDPQVGVLGCRMEFLDGRLQYTARRFRSISWELLDLFRFIPLLMPYKARAKRMLGKYFRHDADMYCDWLNGAFFLFPKKILKELPGEKLDDRFFMYGEDQLWCEQIQQLGYRNLFYAGTSIVHINGGSTELSKQLRLRNVILQNELVIMRNRKGKGGYYFVFSFIYGFKEKSRNFVKSVYYRLTGRLIQ